MNYAVTDKTEKMKFISKISMNIEVQRILPLVITVLREV